MLRNFFYDGGFGMYPTLIVGFLLVISGVLIAIRPQRRFLPLLYSLGFFTIGSGLLGTTMGLINTFRYIQKVPAADQFKIFALGSAESLNNLVLALLLVVFTCLLAAVAAVRGLRGARPAEA